MARAIAAFSGSAAAWLPRPVAGMSLLLTGVWRAVTHGAARPYRPERHYMRGPGPAWRAKHGTPPVG
ncbi:MAG TPA: hypothetical protein VFT69_07100 [Pseudolabrys sp.]|jgi:hypothetical protein|nr:hypothetical protein [Pseudolabrys sp.]